MLVSQITTHSNARNQRPLVIYLQQGQKSPRHDHVPITGPIMVGAKEKISKLRRSEGRKTLFSEWFLQIKYFTREPFYWSFRQNVQKMC